MSDDGGLREGEDKNFYKSFNYKVIKEFVLSNIKLRVKI